ncbi:MAG: glycosyltransferase family 9 protein [Rhodospirillaceae bacterium]|jgi:heptosyltransferase III|nr:glycosyltransferase family 9 protein [Rhodospirillaceae bacterium]
MKVLFVTSTRIGDAILSTGLLEHLRAEHPDLEVTIACGPAAAPLFEALPGLRRIIVLDKMVFSLHWLRLWVLTVTTFWDLIIDLRNAPVTYILGRKKRRGMPRDDSESRQVERIARILDLPEIVPPKLWTSEREDNLAKFYLPEGGPILAIGPTANWQAKTWRPEYFTELIERLTASDGILPGARVVLLGRDDERPMALRLIDSIPGGRLIDLVGKLDLLTAYACLARSAFYIGNDSGLMHLAAASGVPTLGLFGPTKEELYAPWGENATIVRTTLSIDEIFPENFDHRTSDSLMDTLTVDMAEEGARSLWQKCQGENRSVG